MSYSVNLGQWNQIFAVPAAVVDRHIKLASEAQLKVLLYILRHAGEAIEPDTLTSSLNISAEEAENAIGFWKERELLTGATDSLTPLEAPLQQISSAEISEPAPEPVKKPRTAVSRAQRPDPMFVSKLLREDAVLAGLLEEAQTTLNKPLSPGDTATLVMLYNSFGLPCEVIAMLISYLGSTGNANMRAIERMGIRWADDGIKSADEAEREIARMTDSREAWGRVSRLLGIHNVGNPTKSQMEHADRWLNSWEFSDEMITEAYERCVNTKGEYNIRYINAILQRWYAKNIKSLDDLKAEESDRKKKPKQKSGAGKGAMFSTEGASFDVSKFEDNSLFDD